MSGRSSCVEPELSKDKRVLLKDTTQWRQWSSYPGVKHSTTEPLCSLRYDGKQCGCHYDAKDVKNHPACKELIYIYACWHIQWVCDQVRVNPACSAKETSYNIEISPMVGIVILSTGFICDTHTILYSAPLLFACCKLRIFRNNLLWYESFKGYSFKFDINKRLKEKKETWHKYLFLFSWPGYAVLLGCCLCVNIIGCTIWFESS